MSDRLFGVLGNERLELALCPLVVEEGAAGAAEQRGELRPGIRGAHVDDADRLDARPRRFGIMGIVISTHLPPPVMIDSTEVLKWVTHILCWTWAIYFSAAASSENDHGSRIWLRTPLRTPPRCRRGLLPSRGLPNASTAFGRP